MTKEKAYQILGLEEGASLEDAHHARNNLAKIYHPQGKNPNDEKYFEAEEAYKYLKNLEKGIITEEVTETTDSRPLRNKDSQYTTKDTKAKCSKKDSKITSSDTKTNSGKNEKQKYKEKDKEKNPKKERNNFQKFISGETKKEKAFDELIKVRNQIEEERKNLKTKATIKYDEKLYELSNRGLLGVKELQEEEKRIKELFREIVNSVTEYDKLQEIIKIAKEKFTNWHISMDMEFQIIDPKYRGFTDASEFKRIRLDIEDELKKTQGNIDEMEIFLAFIDEVTPRIQQMMPNMDILEYKKGFEEKKGMISAKTLQEERIKVNNRLEVKEQLVSDFKKFFEETEARIILKYNVTLKKFKKYYDDNPYQYTEKTLNNVKKQIEEHEKLLDENNKACNEFLAFYANLSQEEKELYKKIIDIDELSKSENKVKYSRTNYIELKEKLKSLQEEKQVEEEYLKAVTEFNEFFDNIEEKLKKEYGINLNIWKKYRSENYPLDVLEHVKNDILEYEKEIKEKAMAYDEFIAFYESFTEEERNLFINALNLNKYIAKENRLVYSKEDFDKLRNKILDIKSDRDFKEKQERDLNVKKEFINFFKEEEEKLGKQYVANLNKWRVFANEENSFTCEDYSNAKTEILAFEQELKARKDSYIKEILTNGNKRTFDDVIATEAKNTIERINEEKKEEEAYLKVYNEFISFFEETEKRLKKLYGIDLSEWRKYYKNKEISIRELREAQTNIYLYEIDIKKRAMAYDEFVEFYNNLSDEDKKLYKSVVNVDSYLSKENRTLYSKDTYEDLKDKVLKYKQEKELKEKKEHYKKVKQDFISIFNEKETIFKNLYNTDLYKWRKYSLEENDFLEDDYFNVQEEIAKEEQRLEDERMNDLELLQKVLNILGLNIEKYLIEKNQDIKTVSTKDIGIYYHILSNIAYVVLKILKLNGGREKLNSYLEKEQKTILEIPWNELEELYKTICIEVEKEEISKNKKTIDDSYQKFRNFYQSKIYTFRNLYDKDLSKWNKYLKESNKDKYRKEDYLKAINEIKEEEQRLENERNDLLSNLRVSLQRTGFDINTYLDVRNKTYLNISLKELKEYIKAVDLIPKIWEDEHGKIILQDYLETTNVKLIELDPYVIITMYAMIKEEIIDETNGYNPTSKI